jgi:NAD-dependent deacetylase
MNELQTLKPHDCAELIKCSRSVVALTGAGISTAAGIPDFRGPQGLYVSRRYDPEKVFDIRWFHREPRYFYEFARDFVDMASTIRPTFTHFFLTQLAVAGKNITVITQNIDMLHQMAGSRRVVELHGSYGSAACCSCSRSYDGLTYPWWDEAMRTSPCAPVALCPACNGVLKPDIVFFGEMVNCYEESESVIKGCELLLVLGSSLSVTPASRLPYAARGTTVVVNQGSVTLGPAPHRFFIDSEVDVYLQEVATSMGMTLAGNHLG